MRAPIRASIAAAGMFMLAAVCGHAFAQWKQTGPFGGRVNCIIAPGTDIYLGMVGGVFRSSDAGQSWNRATSGLMDSTVLSLAVSGNNLFAGTSGFAAFRSTNGGESWTRANVGMMGYQVRSLAVTGNQLYAATESEIARSDNWGDSWYTRTNGLPATGFRALAVSGSLVFVGSDSGVFVSTNWGTMWQSSSAGLTDVHVRGFAVAGSDMYAATGGGAFHSSDAGAHWAPCGSALAHTGVSSIALLGNFVVAGTDSSGIYWSTDKGGVWTPAEAGLTSINGGSVVHTLAFSGGICVAGTEGGAFVSSDSARHWVHSSTGLAPFNIVTLTYHDSALYAASVGRGLFRSFDGGRHWAAANAGLTNPAIHSISATDSVFLVGTEGGVFRMHPGDSVWTASDSGLHGVPVDAFGFLGRFVLAGTPGGPYRSSDGCASWSPANQGMQGAGKVYVFFRDKNRLLAGTDRGVYFSGDSGATWSGLGLSATPIMSLVSVGESIVAGGFGIFASTDSGRTWSPIEPVIQGAYAGALAVVGNCLYAARVGGVIGTCDGGRTWVSFNEGIPFVNQYFKSFATVGGDVFTCAALPVYLDPGAQGGGVYRRPVAEIILGISPVPAGLPGRPSLMQNYPNPFNPSTTIRFTLPRASHVTLAVFSVLGQRIRTLVDGPRAAGPNVVQFDASGLSSGMYFYRLDAGGRVEVKSCMVLR